MNTAASVDDVISLQQKVFDMNVADRFIVCFADNQYLSGIYRFIFGTVRAEKR